MSSDVERWLKQNGLEIYLTVFADNHINLEMLADLTDVDLREMGLTVGHRIVFRHAVEELARGTGAPDPVDPSDTGQSPSMFAGERKLVTVVFCDIVNSTVLTGRTDIEELDVLQQQFFALCNSITREHGGILTSKLGDGVSCIFGWPQAHEDDPIRAVHCGLAMATRIPTIKVPDWRLDVRVTVTTGHVVVSGTDRNDTPQIVGEAPNLAERMKDACPVASVAVDRLTRRLTGNSFELASLGSHEFKGFGEEIEIWQVVASRAGLSRFESRGITDGSRLVGREDEVALLQSRWDNACESHGQVVLLTGHGGIGKSRLADALARSVVDQPHHLQLYQCSPINQNTVLYPLLNRIMRVSAIEAANPPAEQLAKLRSFLGDRPREDKQVANVFASLLSIPEHEGFAVPSISPDRWRQTIFETVVNEISELAARKPVLITIEDVHWIDPTSLELLDQVRARIEDLPVLVLVTSRNNDLAKRWERSLGFTLLQLNPLSADAARRLCEDVLGEDASATADLGKIVDAARGLPLFLEELAKAAREAGDPAHGSVGRQLANMRAGVPITDQLFSFLSERLDRLDSEAGTRQVVQTAAVFGREFSADMLEKVVSLHHVTDFVAAIGELVRAGVLVALERDRNAIYEFRHALFREAAYASLLRGTRRQIHREIAEALVNSVPRYADIEPEVVAYHFTEAEQNCQAVTYWTMAGERAALHSAITESLNHFRHGIELIDRLPEEAKTYELEVPLRLGFCAAAAAIEGWPATDIEQNYRRVLTLVGPGLLDLPRDRFRAHLGLGAFYYVAGDLESGREHCQQCLSHAKRSGAQDELLHSYRILGELDFYEGNFALSCQNFKASLALYNEADHPRLVVDLYDDPGVLSRSYMSLSLWFLGRADQARKCCSEGLDLAERLGHAFTLAQAEFYAAWLHALLRDYTGARAFAERAIERCSEHEFSLVLGLSQVIRGWASTMLGAVSDGETDIASGMALIRGPHADICESCFLLFEAEHLLKTGHATAGLSKVEESVIAAAESFADPERLRLDGELIALSDSDQGAERVREAVRRAEEQASPAMRLRATLSLCSILDDNPAHHDALDQLRTVSQEFSEGHDTADLRLASKLLSRNGSKLSTDG